MDVSNEGNSDIEVCVVGDLDVEIHVKVDFGHDAFVEEEEPQAAAL